MTRRILVDENTSPRVAEALRANGREAVHVRDVMDTGITDRQIREYAIEHDCIVCTHDDDFLQPKHEAVPVLYYSDDTLTAEELVARIERFFEYVSDPRDLPSVTNLGDWE